MLVSYEKWLSCIKPQIVGWLEEQFGFGLYEKCCVVSRVKNWWYHMNNHRFNQNLMIDIQIEIWWVLSIYPSFWTCFVLVRSFDMSLCRKLFKNVWFTQKVSVHWGLQLGQLLSSHPTEQKLSVFFRFLFISFWVLLMLFWNS